jgi:ATP-binding cassette, subfamily B, bacterial
VWRAAPSWTLAGYLLMLAQGLLPLALLVLTKWIVDAVAAGVASPDHAIAWRQVLGYIIAAGVVAVAMGLAATAAATVSEMQARTVTDAVIDRIHRKASEVDIAFFDNPAGHDALYRAQAEAAYRPASVVGGLNQVLLHGVSAVAIAGLLASLEWWMAAVLLLAAVPNALVRARFSERFFGWAREHTQAERRAWYYHFVLSDGGHAREIRLFDLGRMFGERYQEIRAALRAGHLALGRRRLAGDLIGQIVASVLVFGTYAFVAARALAGAISLGGFVMYFQAFQRGLTSLHGLLSGIASLYEDSLFLRNYEEFLTMPARVVDPSEPLPFPVSVPAPESPGLAVELEKVTFRYPGSARNALADVSVRIGAGEVVALVGANGSGKSTLVKLLCRFYDPDSGGVRIDGIDLRHVAQADLRRQISAIFQDFVRYDLTIRENVQLADVATRPGEATGRRVERAVVRAGAAELVARMPAGLDTVLGRWFDGGVELSAGEWQKIALARALHREARIVVMDEPSSGLDALAEERFFAGFRVTLEGRTGIVVSHRFSTVRTADRILVLDAGRLVEVGSHVELVAACGLYARMFEAQARSYR